MPSPVRPRRRSGALRPLPVAVCTLSLAVLVGPGHSNRPDTARAAEGAPSAPVTLGGPYGRIPLNTGWTEAGDPKDRGFARNWRKGGFSGRTVELPYVPNASHITGASGVLNYRGSIAWYRRSFDVQSDGQYALHFGSVNHKARVYVDGKRVTRHTGEFLPFEAHVSLKAGRHTVVVRADWRNPERMKQQGWHRLWFNFGGINREVTLRRLGPSEIRAPFVSTSLRADGSARVTVSADVVNRSVTRDVQLAGLLRRDGQDVPLTFRSRRIPGSRDVRISASTTIDDPKLWSPGSPNLYDLVLTVPGESAYQTRTGLRQVTRRGTAMYLNGKRIQMRGASIHEDAPGYGTGLHPAQMDELVSELKAIGANATRSQHPLSPALVERLDAAGIMVWQGVGPTDSPGAWTERSARQQRTARQRVMTTLREQQTHPSIIVWNLVNEISTNGHDHGQVSYVKAMSRTLHRDDPSRLVALDIWGTHLPKRLGSVYDDIDAVGITSYLGWYTAPGRSMSSLRRRLKRYSKHAEHVFGDKPIVYTEFGAEANGENPASKPGGYRYQARLLDTTIRTNGVDPRISGMLVWNLRDFGVSPTFLGGSIRNTYKGPLRLVRGLNQKGLFTYGGRPKPSVAVVRQALSAIKAAAPGT